MIRSFVFLRNFLGAVKEHRQVEEEVLEMLEEFLGPQYIGRREIPLKTLAYLQKNFFSTLFLAVYRAVGIPVERRLFYGVINHCLRGIVTGTDNLLDNEYKEMLPLAFASEAVRFKSVMHILLFDRFLFQYPLKKNEMLDIDADRAMLLQKELFAALVPIGAGEALEERGVEQILTPNELLQSVHMYKGGKLLCLSFIAPCLLEKELNGRLAVAENGIFSIGLALQVIDDLTDFYEDVAARNHNYLLSVIEHEGGQGEKAKLREILSRRAVRGEPVEKLFGAGVALAMARAIGEALHGFDLLAEAGFPLDRTHAALLIRQLFKLRGVGRLLPFFPDEKKIGARLGGEEAMSCACAPPASSPLVGRVASMR